MSPSTPLVIIVSLILSSGVDSSTSLPASSNMSRIKYSTTSTSTSTRLVVSLGLPSPNTAAFSGLTNLRRQIGNSSRNPIWNLHTKVNGQGEGGRVELNVTDVSPSPPESNTSTTFKRPQEEPHPADPKYLNHTSSHPANTTRGGSSGGANVTKDPDETQTPPTTANTLISYNSSNHVHHHSVPMTRGDPQPALKTIVLPERDEISEGSGTDLQAQPPCSPVIVNQTESGRKADVDKWATGLVRITQCIANCLSTLSIPVPTPRLKYSKYNKMSGKTGDAAGSAPRISSQGHNHPSPSNGDNTRMMKHNLNDKLLSSCQKTCKFLPRKSTTRRTTPRSSPPPSSPPPPPPSMKKKVFLLQRNKAEEMKRIPILPSASIQIPTKPSHPSLRLEITPTDTGAFILKWPTISSPTSSHKSPRVILYTIVLFPQDDTQTEPRSPPWKLIDQTLAQETQISLLVNLCQEENLPPPNLSSNNTKDLLLGSGGIIRVLAVSSQGLEKLFSGYLSCCKGTYHNRKDYDTTVSGDPRPFTGFPEGAHQNPTNLEISKGLRKKVVGSGGENFVPAPSTISSPPPPPLSKSWGLRTESMVYENYLMVTEVSWTVPEGLSNHEKNLTRDRSGDEGCNFLLTWEIFGGGLRGNLVTDTTSGTISLWPDTAYFVQVGIINKESSDLVPPPTQPLPSTSKTNTSAPNASSESGAGEGNYLKSNLGLESIIFPLSDGEPPSVTLKSELLFVNTSQLGIPTTSSPSSSSSSGIRSSSGSKSNNPLLPQEHGKSFYPGQGKDVSSIQIGFGPRTLKITTTTPKHTTPTMSSSSSRRVSKNINDPHQRNDGYENGHGYLADSPQGSEYYEQGARGSYQNTLRRKSSTSGPNGYEDKNPNINDNKSNNNLKPKSSPKPVTIPPSTPDHHRNHNHRHGMFSRPDIYESLFALDSQSSEEENVDGDSGGGSTTNNIASRPTLVYSIFVLVIIACIIFIFLVSFIGFFVVTSSISKTAQYFVPKRVRVWVVGESRLLGDDPEEEENGEEEELEYGRGQRDVEDLEEEGPEWDGMNNMSTVTTSMYPE